MFILKLGNKLKTLWDICCFNTLYFNFRYLPFRIAVKFPIWASRNVRIRAGKGEVSIVAWGEIHSGMIRIGLDSVGIFDNKKSRSIWQVYGKVIFQGKCFLGHGCKISVEHNASLSFGKNFHCSAESSISTVQDIAIGDDCLFSWDILVMDTDWHRITNVDGNTLNPPRPVRIGNRVWIGCRTIILKGVSIADGTIVAAGSIISKDVTECNCIVGKSPQQIIRENVKWHI